MSVLLGVGLRPFDDIDDPKLSVQAAETTTSPRPTHLRYKAGRAEEGRKGPS